jgi:hypothetical protein
MRVISAQPGEDGGGGGERSPPFTKSTIMYKVAVYAPAERQIHYPNFSSTPMCTYWPSHTRAQNGGECPYACMAFMPLTGFLQLPNQQFPRKKSPAANLARASDPCSTEKVQFFSI